MDKKLHTKILIFSMSILMMVVLLVTLVAGNKDKIEANNFSKQQDLISQNQSGLSDEVSQNLLDGDDNFSHEDPYATGKRDWKSIDTVSSFEGESGADNHLVFIGGSDWEYQGKVYGTWAIMDGWTGENIYSG